MLVEEVKLLGWANNSHGLRQEHTAGRSHSQEETQKKQTHYFALHSVKVVM